MPKKDEVLKFQQKPGGSTYRGAVYVTTGGGTTTNADTVDGFHASATATANTLLACDANGDLPTDITGDADTVDGYDATDFLSPQYVTLATDTNLSNERVLTAGDGLDLTDGGAGSTVTLAVDVTDFIDTSYGLTESSNNIRVNPGTGMAFSGGALYAYGLRQSDYGANALVADTAGDMTAYGSLDFNVAESITTSAGNLTLAPTGDLMLDPTGAQVRVASSHTLQSDNYASQTTGWGITYGGDGDFRYLYADELHAKAFIADLEQALAGGQIIAKSVAILSRNFTAPAASGSTTMYVWDLPSAENMAVFESGDIVRLRQFSRSAGSLTISDCWGVVTSYSNLSDKEQSWTFTRSSGGNAGAMAATTTVYADSIVLDYGTDGNGFWEVNAIDGAYAVNSPYAQVVTWATHPHSGKTVRVRLGQLTGITSTDEYGLFAGDGVAATDSYMTLSDVGLEVHNLSTGWYDDEGTQRIGMDPGADPDSPPDVMMWAGVSSSDPGFIVYGDGSVWLSTLAITEDAGDLFFSQSDGLALWGPGQEISSTSWIGSRGQVCTIANAFHQETGRWPMSQGLVVEPGTTNKVTNPSFGTGTTGWTASGSNTIAQSDEQSRWDGYSLKVTYQDTAALAYHAQTLTAAKHYASAWVYIPSNWDGGAVYLDLANFTGSSGNTVVKQWGSGDPTGIWTLLVSHNTPVGGDLSGHVRISTGSAPTAGRYIYLDGVQVETPNHTTTCIGSMAWCAWSGTAHASTSTRTGITTTVPVGQALVAAEGSLSVWFKLTSINNSVGFVWQAGNASSEFEAFIDTTGYLGWRSNGGTICNSAAASIVADTWYHAVFTWDYPNTAQVLYLNGVEVDTATDGTNPTLGTSLGIGYTPLASATYNLNGIVAEFATFTAELTAEQVAALYAMQRPLVDVGATETPGIYVLDGKFNLSSSTGDERIEITADEIAGYSGGTKQFYLSATDGTAYCGGGAVTLDANGVRLDIGSDNWDKIEWMDGANVAGEIYVYSTGEPVMDIYTTASGAGTEAYIDVRANVGAGNSGIGIEQITGGASRTYLVANNTLVIEAFADRFEINYPTFLNDEANTKMTMGLTINQVAYDDEILALKSSDVAHGATDVTETDTFGYLKKVEGDAGGLRVGGAKDSGGVAGAAVVMEAFLAENVDTTKSTAGLGIVHLEGYETSGTAKTNTVADGNVLVVRTFRGGANTTLFIIDEDGDIHYDGSAGAYDEHDDALAVAQLAQGLGRRWDDALAYNFDQLQEMGVISGGDRDHPFVSTKALNALLMGAIGQLYERCRVLENKIERGQICTS